jgi:uncharacterized protein DUF2442
MHAHANAEEDFTAEIIPPIRPSAPWRIAEVRPMPDFSLWVRFNDGTEGTVAMSGFLHSSHAGVFSALRDEELFSRVSLDYGAVTWPGELDLAPDAMYEAIRRDGQWILQ